MQFFHYLHKQHYLQKRFGRRDYTATTLYRAARDQATRSVLAQTGHDRFANKSDTTTAPTRTKDDIQ